MSAQTRCNFVTGKRFDIQKNYFCKFNSIYIRRVCKSNICGHEYVVMSTHKFSELAKMTIFGQFYKKMSKYGHFGQF